MVQIRFDKSQPRIVEVDTPGQVPTGNEFTMSVKVANDSSIVVPQTGTCQSGIMGTNVAWWTPVHVLIDGEKVATNKFCLDGTSGTKSEEFRVEINEPGEHTITVQAIREPQNEVADEWVGSIQVASDARDPAKPSPLSGITEMLSNLLGGLGNMTGKVALLGAIALGVFLLV